MITRRTIVASCFAMFATFAACQSVRTQGVPVVDDGETPQMVGVEYDELGNPVAENPPAATPDAEPETQSAPEVANASTPTPAPSSRAPKHAYNEVSGVGPYIALTFDDGPHPVHTPKLLDTLKQKGIRATFYVIGRSVETYPEIAKRIVAEGHEIANHTWSHPALTKLSASGVEREITRTTEVIQRVTGVRPTNMRPPYGATNARLNKRLDEEFGLKVIMWSVDPLDWKYRNSARVTSEILTNTRPGGIVLAHDIHPTTVAAMPATIDGLKSRGFRFVTVSELLAMEQQGGDTTLASEPRPLETPSAATSPEPAGTPFVITRTELSSTPEPSPDSTQ